METPNYHKNIALHNFQETKENKTKTFPFPITINYQKLCHVLLLTIGSSISSNQGFIPSFHIAKVSENFFLQQIQKVYDGMEIVGQNN